MIKSFRVYDLLKQQYIADEAMYFLFGLMGVCTTLSGGASA